MNDIFISYKREEQPVAKRLADALQKKGWSVWWDPKLRAGEHFDDAIEKALIDAKCVIVMWSKLSIKSRYVKDEATYALNRRKLVPIKIEEVDLPFRFEGIQTGQLINWDGSDDFSGFQKLVKDITSKIGTPSIEVEISKHTVSTKEQNREPFARRAEGENRIKAVEKVSITDKKTPLRKMLAFGIGVVTLIAILSVIGWYVLTQSNEQSPKFGYSRFSQSNFK